MELFVTAELSADRDHVLRTVKIRDTPFLVMKGCVVYGRNHARTIRCLALPFVMSETESLIRRVGFVRQEGFDCCQ